MKNLTAKQKEIKVIMIKMSKSATISVSYKKLSKPKPYKSINQSFNINTNINSDPAMLSNLSMLFNPNLCSNQTKFSNQRFSPSTNCLKKNQIQL